LTQTVKQQISVSFLVLSAKSVSSTCYRLTSLTARAARTNTMYKRRV